MARQKVVGELVSPKNITHGWYRPKGVLNVAFHRSSSLIRRLLYPIKEGDEHKAAFKTHYGLYEPTVMFFGLTNSLATFQIIMNQIFHSIIAKHELLGTSICVYMDDIAIATQTNDQDHTAAVCNILAVATEHDLYFKLEKCLFHVPSIDYLGVILEKGVTCMNLVNIAGIKNWKTPEKIKDICSFLGFCSFYRAFIKGFSSITRPLSALTKKDQT